MYFPIVGYLTAIEESNDANSMDSNYNQLISKIQLLQYFSLGREYILNYAQSIINKHKDELIKQNEYAALIKNLKISFGNNIEGYMINKYCKVVSKSTFLGIGTFDYGDIGQSIWHGTESDTFSEKLEQARNSSINKMVDGYIELRAPIRTYAFGRGRCKNRFGLFYRLYYRRQRRVHNARRRSNGSGAYLQPCHRSVGRVHSRRKVAIR